MISSAHWIKPGFEWASSFKKGNDDLSGIVVLGFLLAAGISSGFLVCRQL